MAREQVIAAIDVGTTKICTLVGDFGKEGDPQIIGVGIAPSKGLRKGVVVNIDEAVESIRESVERAERSSGFKIVSAHVGIAGSHISSLNNRGVIAIGHTDRIISDEDVSRAIESAKTINIPSNREIIHVIPRSYIVDGQEGVKNPIGMHGFRLDVETHIVTGAVTSIQNLTKCVQRVGVEVDDLVLEPIASSEGVLTEEEKEMGIIIADIGGGTTDIAIFIDGSIWHTSVIPVGGYHLTNDIAIGLRTPFATAEEIKSKYGHAIASSIGPDDKIEIPSFGSQSSRTVYRRQLAEIIEGRVEELLEIILTEVKRSGYDGLLPAGLVLTGGSANLRGIDTLAANVLQLPVRVGVPKGVDGLAEAVANPAYATSVGLLVWGLKHGGGKSGVGIEQQGVKDIYRRFIGWLKELLPA